MSRRFSGEWAELGILGEWIEGGALSLKMAPSCMAKETTVRDLSGFYCKCSGKVPQQEPMCI